MKLNTKLTLSLSFIIILVLGGYGYFHILMRRDILIRKMKVEVRSIGRTLKVSLEKISIPKEMTYVQELIDAVEEHERTLGVIVYHAEREIIFRSRSMEGPIELFVERIQGAMDENRAFESFAVYQDIPIFSYTFPLKDRRGKNLGGVCILQRTSFMEEEIRKAKESIFAILLLLVGLTVTLILLTTRRWISNPISRLMEGIRALSAGDLDFRIQLKGEDELSQLAMAFNQMASDLKKAREKMVQEAERRRELEEGLRRSEKLATIGQLASGLAHEIGTPLNIISGRAELAKRRAAGLEEVQKNLDTILLQSEKISKIIRQLLGFVRKKPPEKHRLNLPALLETTLDFLNPQILKQKVRVLRVMRRDLPPVLGDPDQLQQVFSNLIVNAIQSMPEGGDLTISVSSERTFREGLEGDLREYVVTSIQDTGVGMDPEVLDHLFNPFFTTKETGTGLGLMVSRGIIEDHEGWIVVKSEKGKGSSFCVYLPGLQEGFEDGS